MFYFLLMKLAQIFFLLLFLTGILNFLYSVHFFLQSLVVFIEWEVIEFNSTQIIMTLLLDWMSLSFGGVVMLISSMVMFYSSCYMAHDKTITRFLTLVLLFVVSMILLIFSPNMISILLGWDGLGLVSYCLVIYYQNMKSASAGLLTVLSNRIGDVAILLCIAWMFNFGGWNFYYLPFMFSSYEMMIILSLIVIAAITKSAQIPFSAWLPAAMAAPTPVSSLVHSSTLVTAGVYLLIRFSEVLQINLFLFLCSVLTMFMSGVGANFEMDLKKIIALSTLSQLGVMMMILSLGMKELAYFHLVTHALFKSLLFLCAGVYIHSMSDIQDIRLIGGLSSVLPLTSLFFMGCSLSLCGFPFLSGFYSKDLIIEYFFMQEMNFMIFWMLFLGTMMTATYSLRLIFYIYFKNMGVNGLVEVNEESSMSYPMMVLFFSSVVAGSVFSWFFLPCLTIMLPLVLKCLIILSLIYFVMMVWAGVVKPLLKMNFLGVKTKIIWLLGSMWYLPTLSTSGLMASLKSGLAYFKFLDSGWFEYYGGQGLNLKLGGYSFFSDHWSNLSVKSYLIMTFFLVIFMTSLSFN